MRLILLVLFISVCNSGTSTEDTRIETDWLVIYFMPYDNNLSAEADVLLSELSNSIDKPNVVVAVQTDLADSSGMTRYLFTSDTTRIEKITDENSASIETYQAYLDWIGISVKFKDVIFVFLDHGGALNEVGSDEYPLAAYQKTEKLADAIESFNKKHDVIPELLFLQVCAKGVLEPLFEFRDCAKYTLASQNKLGAPNYYYEDFFEWLEANPKADGSAISMQIAKSDRDDMYYSYSAIDNSKFNAFIKSFNRFAEFLLQEDSLSVHLDSLKCIYYYGESHWDFVTFVKMIKPGSANLNAARLNLLNSFHDLLLFHWINSKNTLMQPYCGISLMALHNAENISRFSQMEIYSETLLDELAGSVFLEGEYIQSDTIDFR